MRGGVNRIKIYSINVRKKDSGINWGNKSNNKICTIMQLFSRKGKKKKRLKISFKRCTLNIILRLFHFVIKINFEKAYYPIPSMKREKLNI